jgi:Ca2+-binding EF-hand superfamily protein
MDYDDPEVVKQVLREKVGGRTRGGFDQMRKIAVLFGQNRGIELPIFRKVLNHQFGIKLNARQADAVFKSFDVDANGTMELREFLQVLMLKDTNKKTLAEVAKEREDNKDLWRKKDRQAAAFPISRVSNERVMGLLRDKVTQRTRNSQDQLRKITQLFGKGQGISIQDFTNVLQRQFGLVLEQNQAQELFRKFDANGNGLISLREFMETVTPKDYEGKGWHIKAHEDLHAKKRRLLAETRAEMGYAEESPSKQAASLPNLRAKIGGKHRYGNPEMSKIIGHEFSEREPAIPRILQRSDKYLSKGNLKHTPIKISKSRTRPPDDFLNSLATLRTARAPRDPTRTEQKIAMKKAEALESLRALKAAVAKHERAQHL